MTTTTALRTLTALATLQALARMQPAQPAVDPIAAWHAEVARRVAAGATRSDAIGALLTERPDLTNAYRRARKAR